MNKNSGVQKSTNVSSHFVLNKKKENVDVQENENSDY